MIIICYSISSRESFKAVDDQWVEAINSHERARTLPIALIATKSDLPRAVPVANGEAQKRSINEDAKDAARELSGHNSLTAS